MLKEKKSFIQSVAFLLFILSVFFVVKTVSEIKGLNSVGAGSENTISVTGTGEIFAVPDIATVSFSVTQESKTVGEAQKIVSTKVASVLAALSDAGIEDRDIKTLSYTSYPKYDYKESTIRCIAYPCPSNGKQIVSGYEVSETISVKIRETDIAPGIVEILGTLGVTNMSGPDFSIDDTDALQALARKQAIDDAKEKAEVLARDLGVKMVRIVQFSENNGGYYPTYLKASSYDSVTVESAVAPQLPQGENKISSSVIIVYQIR